MSYVLAVDVGTTFTAAAISKLSRNQASPPEILPLGLHGTAVPSVLWYGEDGRILFGESAERRGIDDPTRLVREFKRRIGDAVPIAVGERRVPPEEMFATMVSWVVARAEEREGAAPSAVTVTHPAGWGGYRAQIILASLSAAGLPDVTLITEPEAAALHYAGQERVATGSIIAVYDLGGGTFDTAILRKCAGARFEFLGHPQGIGELGGADFDAVVFRHVADHTGEGLLGLDPYAPPVLQALNLLKRECTEAKEALSSDSEATIRVLLPGIQQQVRLVRSEFEEMIAAPVHDTLEVLVRCLKAAELEPQDLSAVLLIGGSSRIPLIAQLISEQLGRPIAVDADPKSSICLGAAMAGATALQDAAEPAVMIQPEQAPANQQRHDTLIHRRDVHDPGIPIAAAAAPGIAVSNKAPRGRKRLTAIALAAMLLTSVTATAAQGPGILGDLSSLLEPKGEKQDLARTEVGGITPGSLLGNPQGNSPDSAARQGSDVAADFGSGAPGATYPGASGNEHYGSGPGDGSPGQAGGTGQQGTGQGDIWRNVSAPSGGSDATPDPGPTGSAAVTDPATEQDPTQAPDPMQSPLVPVPDPADPSPEPTTLPTTDTVPDPAPSPDPTSGPTLSPEPLPDPATGVTEPDQDSAAPSVPAV